MSRRNGFTTVELMVVIAIIAILAALIMMGVQSVRGREQSMTTANEIREMTIALEKFNAKYKVYPPSLLQLTTLEKDLDATTKKSLFRIWPSLNYANIVSTFNVTGTATTPTVVKGDQCLVLFLGGRQSATGCKGFSNRPSNPFEEPAATDTTDVDHEAPFFNFKGNRLVKASGSQFLSYHDAYSTPGEKTPYASYAYFAPRGGVYIDTDCDGLVDLGGQYPKPHQSGGKGINLQSFQIISPGRDRLWGASTTYTAGSPPSGFDPQSADNFSNFANGMLSASN